MFSTAIFLSFLPPGGEYPRSSGYRYKLAETPIQSPVYFYVSTSNAFYQAIVDTLAITRKQFCSTRVFSLSLSLSLRSPFRADFCRAQNTLSILRNTASSDTSPRRIAQSYYVLRVVSRRYFHKFARGKIERRSCSTIKRFETGSRGE